ncbi:VOC family protein [Cellulomonas fengjieae]|uniref:VOC family protein n=1 Tax=Cellulomonas fengjieae TaxID=2819978 RepID=UPI003556B0FD
MKQRTDEGVVMADLSRAFSGFSTDDVPAAKAFYSDLLGLDVTEENGMLFVHLDGHDVLIYPKGSGHTPATYTVLNFPVEDVPGTVGELRERGVQFERYEGTPAQTDDDYVLRSGGPLVAWFTDPAGNILSVVEAS